MNLKKKLTDRQRAYRKYLQSEHWIQLRDSAFARDAYTCQRCKEAQAVQVHHLKYRTPYELGVLEDLISVCIDCHRAEHGYWVSPFQRIYRKARARVERGTGILMPNEFEEMYELAVTEHQRRALAGLCRTSRAVLGMGMGPSQAEYVRGEAELNYRKLVFDLNT